MSYREMLQIEYDKQWEKTESLLQDCIKIKNWGVTLWIAIMGLIFSSRETVDFAFYCLPFTSLLIFFVMETMWRTVREAHVERAKYLEKVLSSPREENAEYAEKIAGLGLNFFLSQDCDELKSKLGRIWFAAKSETNWTLYFLMAVISGLLFLIS